MENTYFEDEKKYSKGLYLSMAMLALFTLMGFGIDLDEYNNRTSLQIPDWYFYIIFTVDVLAFLSVVAMTFFKKVAVFTFPLFVILHFFLHQFYLSTFLYTDVTNIFLFVGLGLFMIIPKWKFFN